MAMVSSELVSLPNLHSSGVLRQPYYFAITCADLLAQPLYIKLTGFRLIP